MKHSNKKRYQLSKNKGNSQTKKRKSFSKTKITPLFREQADLVFHQGQLLWTFGVSLGRRRNIIDGATCVEIQKVLYLICIYVYIYTHYMYTVYIHISNWYGRIIWIIYFLGSWPKKAQEVAQLIYFCSCINWVSPSDRSSSSFAQAGVTLIQLLTGQHLIPGSLQKWMLVVFFLGGSGCLGVTP